jgi:molybdopterin molybdotransferase
LRVKQAQNEQGETVLKLFPHQGSGVLTSMAWADGLVELAPGQSVAVGDMLPFTPFPW